MTAAILTAAGTGQRMHLETPKQFLKVHGKPILQYTIDRFQNHPEIDAICVVTLPDWIDTIRSWTKTAGFSKLRWVVPGGATGQDSIRNGLEELARHLAANDTVIVHDGNRAMVSDRIISDALACCRKYGSAVPVIPCVEVIYQSESGETPDTLLPREKLWRTQTPHAYPLGDLIWAHGEAKRKGITGTAASVDLFHKLGRTSHFCPGSETNLKITTQADLAIFRALLAVEKNPSIED